MSVADFIVSVPACFSFIPFVVMGMDKAVMSDQSQNIAGDSISHGPLLNSKKIYVPEVLHDGLILQVPMREISMKNGAHLAAYDASGPYTDARVDIDIHKGLTDVRSSWILTRDDTELYRNASTPLISSEFTKKRQKSKFYNVKLQRSPRRARQGRNITQLHYARRGIITPEMEYIAIRENQTRNSFKNEIEECVFGRLRLGHHAEGKIVQKLRPITAEFVRKEIAEGRAIIPANINHSELEPMIVGRNFLVKINANLMGVHKSNNIEEILEKLIWSTRWGADMIMDFSSGDDADAIRDYVVRNSSVPVGSAPIYRAFEKVDGVVENLTWDIFRDTLIEQAEQGVDYFSINVGVSLAGASVASKAMGSSIIAKWCAAHQKESFLYTHFEDICSIMKAYDVSLSLSCDRQFSSVFDENDKVLTTELMTLGELTKIAWQHDVQVMVEGPDHSETFQLKQNMDQHLSCCHGTPFYSHGLVATDNVRHTDDGHCGESMGAAMIAWHGCSILCYIIPQEKLLSADKANIKEGLIAYKFAAHTADLAKRHPGAYLWDKMSPTETAKAENFCSTMYNPNFSSAIGV